MGLEKIFLEVCEKINITPDVTDLAIIKSRSSFYEDDKITASYQRYKDDENKVVEIMSFKRESKFLVSLEVVNGNERPYILIIQIPETKYKYELNKLKGMIKKGINDNGIAEIIEELESRRPEKPKEDFYISICAELRNPDEFQTFLINYLKNN